MMLVVKPTRTWAMLTLPLMLASSLSITPTPSPAPVNPPTTMTTVEVPNALTLGAVLPDGKPFAYTLNYRPNATGWIIHMSGGGWNFLKNETNDDRSRQEQTQQLKPILDGVATVALAANASGESGCYGICDGIMSNDPVNNPDFATWNKVFIPIGDRTAFTADRWAGTPLFRGKRNLDATIDDLMTRFNMTQATHVVLTGGSSGGHATYLNCDRIANKVARRAPAVEYACLADAGFFIKHDTVAGVPAATNSEFEQSFYAWNSSAAINEDCLAHYAALGAPEQCIFAQNVLPFIKSRLFIMQNLYDSWQMANILGIRCATYGKDLSACSDADMTKIQNYGADMRNLLAGAVANPAVGLYAPSCIAHCQSVENEHPESLWHWPGRWSINGTTAALSDKKMHYPRETFGDWFFRRNATHTVVQKCNWGASCNSLCPLFT